MMILFLLVGPLAAVVLAFTRPTVNGRNRF